MTKRQIESEAKQIARDAAEYANDGPGGRVPPHVQSGGQRLGPKERQWLADKICDLVERARA